MDISIHAKTYASAPFPATLHISFVLQSEFLLHSHWLSKQEFDSHSCDRVQSSPACFLLLTSVLVVVDVVDNPLELVVDALVVVVVEDIELVVDDVEKGVSAATILTSAQFQNLQKQ